jgi:hypothetical protein
MLCVMTPVPFAVCHTLLPEYVHHVLSVQLFALPVKPQLRTFSVPSDQYARSSPVVSSKCRNSDPERADDLLNCISPSLHATTAFVATTVVRASIRPFNTTPCCAVRAFDIPHVVKSFTRIVESESCIVSIASTSSCT